MSDGLNNFRSLLLGNGSGSFQSLLLGAVPGSFQAALLGVDLTPPSRQEVYVQGGNVVDMWVDSDLPANCYINDSDSFAFAYLDPDAKGLHVRNFTFNYNLGVGTYYFWVTVGTVGVNESAPSPMATGVVYIPELGAPYAQGDQFKFVFEVAGGNKADFYASTTDDFAAASYIGSSGVGDGEWTTAGAFTIDSPYYFFMVESSAIGDVFSLPSASVSKQLLPPESGFGFNPFDATSLYVAGWDETYVAQVFRDGASIFVDNGHDGSYLDTGLTTFTDYSYTMRYVGDFNGGEPQSWGPTSDPIVTFASFGPITVNGASSVDISQPIERNVGNYVWGLLNGDPVPQTSIITVAGGETYTCTGADWIRSSDSSSGADDVIATGTGITFTNGSNQPISIWNGKP